MDKLLRRNTFQSALACCFALAYCNSVFIDPSMAGAADTLVTNDSSSRKGATAPDANTSEDETITKTTSVSENTDTQNSSSEINAPKTANQDNKQTHVTLAQWVTDWMKNPRKVTARLAIHGVVPEIELQAVIPVAQQKICADGKCYEVDQKMVEGKPCDQSLSDEENDQNGPIRVAPAAPPIPPSFPFAFEGHGQDSSVIEMHLDTSEFPQAPIADAYDIESFPNHDPYGSLSQTQISVPASMLVAYMVAHAQNTVRLEMTEQLAAERAMYAQRYELLLQHNQQLQTQLAVLEARQQTTEALALRASGRQLAATSCPTPPTSESAEDKRCQNLTASKEDWDAVQEDLSNIRQQIALLKKSNPVPFATSNIGTQETNPSRQPQTWRTARSVPYVPVFPSVGKNAETTKK